MSTGPVQLLVVGFDEPDFSGAITTELDKLRASGIVRVIDAIGVRKDADGGVQAMQVSDLSLEQAQEFGAMVGALIGLGVAGEEGMAAGAQLGAAATEDGFLFTGEHIPDVVAQMPADSAAAVILLEHLWAAPLRDAVVEAGGFPVANAWVRPADLVAIGLVARD